MIIYVAVAGVLIWLCFLMGLLIFSPKESETSATVRSPFVSIIVSLRNEEANVQSLCESLSGLTYPASSFEILFGNDASTDQTGPLLDRFKTENAVVCHFSESDTGPFGKQKVLEALVSKAKGDYFLFTDADMTFDADWVQAMLSQTRGDLQLMVGLTCVGGDRLFDQIQNLDWLFHEQITAWFAERSISLTAWGNNMLISRKTFESIGGYRDIKASIVEDVDLLKKVISNKGRLVVNTNSKAVGVTQPMNDVLGLLHQRKRWMKGMTGISPAIWTGVLIKLAFWPMLLYLISLNSLWIWCAFVAFGLKIAIFRQIPRITKNDFPLTSLMIFEVYDLIFYLLTFAFCILPVKTKWKGRVY